MRNSLFDDTAAVASVHPAVLTTGTVEGHSADRNGTGGFFRVAMLVVSSGAVTDGTHAWTIEVSDNDADWAAAPAADLIGSAVAYTDASDAVIKRLSYIGVKRYVRAKCVSADAAVGGLFTAVILLGQGSGVSPN